MEGFCKPIAAGLREIVLGPGIGDGPVDQQAAEAARPISDGQPCFAGGAVTGLRQDLLTLGRTQDVVDGQVLGLVWALLVALEDTLPAAIALATVGGEPLEYASPVRGDTPLLGLFRTVAHKRRLGDQVLARNETVFVAFAGANAHARRTGSRRDFSFGAGIHACPARPLVNRTVAHAAELGHSRLRLTEPVCIRPHSHFRGPAALNARVLTELE